MISPNTTISGLLSPNNSESIVPKVYDTTIVKNLKSEIPSPNNSEAIVPKVGDNETTIVKNPTSKITSLNNITTEVKPSPKSEIAETLPHTKIVITTSLPQKNATEIWPSEKELINTTLLEKTDIEKIKLETTIIKNTTENKIIPTIQQTKTQLILLGFSSFNYDMINKIASFLIYLAPINGEIYASILLFSISITYKKQLRKLQETEIK